MQYQIRDKEPTTLVQAQEMAIKIGLNMQSSGESNLHGYLLYLWMEKSATGITIYQTTLLIL